MDLPKRAFIRPILQTIDQSAQGQRLFEAVLLAIEGDVHRPRLRGRRGEINTRPGDLIALALAEDKSYSVTCL